jgi:hypothetical protein
LGRAISVGCAVTLPDQFRHSVMTGLLLSRQG